MTKKQDMDQASEAKEKTKKKRRRSSSYRKVSAEVKVKAILSLWSERRSSAEICRELTISYTVLQNWQDRAMEAMLERLEPKVREEEEKPPALNPRLLKLLTKKSMKKEAVIEEETSNVQQTQVSKPMPMKNDS